MNEKNHFIFMKTTQPKRLIYKKMLLTATTKNSFTGF